MYVKLAWYLSGVIILCSAVYSQSYDTVKTYSLNEITVTANRFKNLSRDLPTKVDVINSYSLQHTNGFSLTDKLNISPSLFIKSYGTRASLNTLSLNGLGTEHTVILLDGVKLNSFQNSLVDLSSIDIENIERIEIMNNGISTMYGSEAVGGVINLISRKNSDSLAKKLISMKGSISYGSFNTIRSSIRLNQNFNSADASFWIAKETSDGNFDYLFDNGIELLQKKRENSSYSLTDIGFAGNLLLSSSGRINLSSSFSDHLVNIPGIEVGSPASVSFQKDKNWNNILSYENLISQKIILTSRFNFQNNLMKYEIKPNLLSFYKNLVFGFNTDLNFDFSFLKNSFGYNYTSALLKSNELEPDINRTIHAFYLSNQSSVFRWINIYASSRFDYYTDISKNVFTYQVGLNLKPFEEIELRLKANTGKNFRAPAFNDLYWKNSGNKNLRPETAYSNELGILLELKNYLIFNLEITYTNISAKDRIIWLPQRDLIWRPQNINTSISENLLFTISAANRLAESINFRLTAGLNLLKSRKTNSNFDGDPTSGKYFPYIPLESIKSSLFINYQNASLNLFFTHYGERYSDFENLKSMPVINLIDGNISFSFSIHDFITTLKFEVNNISNLNYQILSGYPMPLRNYKLTLSINY